MCSIIYRFPHEYLQLLQGLTFFVAGCAVALVSLEAVY